MDKTDEIVECCEFTPLYHKDTGEELFWVDDIRFNCFDNLVLDVYNKDVMEYPVETIKDMMQDFAKQTEVEGCDYSGWNTKMTTSSLQYAFTNPLGDRKESKKELRELGDIKKFIIRSIIIYEQSWLHSEEINKNWRGIFNEELNRVNKVLDQRALKKGSLSLNLSERLFFQESTKDSNLENNQLFFTETSINYQRASFELMMATLLIGGGGVATDRDFLNQFFNLMVFLDEIRGDYQISPFFYHFFHFFRISYLRRLLTKNAPSTGKTNRSEQILAPTPVKELSLHLGYRKEFSFWRNAEYNGDKRISNAMSSLCSLLSIYPRITEYTKPGPYKTYYINGRFSGMTGLEHIAYDCLPSKIKSTSTKTTWETLCDMSSVDLYIRNNAEVDKLLNKYDSDDEKKQVSLNKIKHYYGYNNTPTEEKATIAYAVQLLEHQKEILSKYKGETDDAAFKRANDAWLTKRTANKVKMLCLNKDGKLLYKEIGTIGELLEAINKSE